MDLVLTELLHCARACIDDVVIFSTTWDDHKQHLKAVLGFLWEVGLTVKPNKCVWAYATCSYLARLLAEEESIQSYAKYQLYKISGDMSLSLMSDHI